MSRTIAASEVREGMHISCVVRRSSTWQAPRTGGALPAVVDVTPWTADADRIGAQPTAFFVLDTLRSVEVSPDDRVTVEEPS